MSNPWDAVVGISSVVTGLAGIAVAGIAGYGLRQLTLTKRDMATRVDRDGALHAIQQCREFCNEIIPAFANTTRAFAQAQTQQMKFTNPHGMIFEPQAQIVGICREWTKPFQQDVIDAAISLLNRLELFALHFTSGLAEADVAFQPTSDVYCQAVIQLYPFLILLRADQDRTLYSNTVKLFRIWIARKTEGQMREQMTQLQRNMTQLEGTLKEELVVIGKDH